MVDHIHEIMDKNDGCVPENHEVLKDGHAKQYIATHGILCKQQPGPATCAREKAQVTQCNTDLTASNGEKAQCNTDLTASNVAKAQCNTDLTASNVAKAQCNTDLTASNVAKAQCNTDLTASNGEKAQCNTDLTASNVAKAQCNTDLTASNGEKAQCNTDLTASNVAKGQCNNNLTKSNEELESVRELLKSCESSGVCTYTGVVSISSEIDKGRLGICKGSVTKNCIMVSKHGQLNPKDPLCAVSFLPEGGTVTTDKHGKLGVDNLVYFPLENNEKSGDCVVHVKVLPTGELEPLIGIENDNG